MSKLLRHLSSLSEKESRRFQKFVQSPYFNQEQKLVQLLQLLDPIPETLDREVLHQAIYPELSFDYPRITNLLSDLSQLVEQFLVVEYQQVPSHQRARTQLASFRTHSNHHDWKLVHQKQVKELHSKSFWSEEDLFHRYALEEEVYVSLLEQDQRVNHQQLEQKIEAMDTYYVAVMLKNVCQWLNHQNVLKEKEENLRYRRFIEFLSSGIELYLIHPLIHCYYQIYLTLTQADTPQHYYTLFQLLNMHHKEIPHEELKPMYQYAQNYCVKRVNQGDSSFLSELLKVYERMLEQGLLFHQGQISASIVKNIVTLGVRLKRYEWTLVFLKKYKNHLPEDQKEAVTNYNLAYIHYHQGEAEKALQHLRFFHFQDIFYLLGSKLLLMKIYVDIHDYESLDAHLHAFEGLLRRDKRISSYQRKNYLATIRMVKRLTNLRTKAITLSPKAFQEHCQRYAKQLQEQKSLLSLAWLRSKLDEIRSEAILNIR